MHDTGFEPQNEGSFLGAVAQTTRDSMQFGWNIAPVRWMTLAGALSNTSNAPDTFCIEEDMY